MKPRLTRTEIPLRRYSVLLDIPSDPEEALSNALESANDPEAAWPADPYWSTLWPAATPMATLVSDHAWTDCDRAIELGCGAGLVGIAALKSGLATALTDYVPDAVDLARHKRTAERIFHLLMRLSLIGMISRLCSRTNGTRSCLPAMCCTRLKTMLRC